MNLFHGLILGIIEGLTEFLPISSTAHLIIASRFLNITQTNFLKLFEVFIQIGAIFAVLILYFKYLIKNKKIIKQIIISFLPTGLIGFFLYKIIKNIFFEAFNLIIFSLFFIGLIFIIFEVLIKKNLIKLTKSLDNLNIWHALIIGFFQSLAVIPGVSRAGSVILSMLVLGYRKEEAVLYSFLLAMPTIFAAGFFDFYKQKEIIFSNNNNLLILFFGFFVSFISAYLSIKWFINFVKKKSFFVFGIYRIVLALILFFLFK